MIDAATADKFDAEVIAAYGRHLLVRAGEQELRARPAGRRLSIVCGDRVRCEVDRAHDEVLAVEVLPRKTLLARANLRGESEPVVANITQLVVVVAPVPQPDFFIVDRYLCAATAAGIRGAVAINKSDLEANKIDPGEIDALRARGLRPHRLLGGRRTWSRRVCARCCRARSACWSASPAWASHRW